MEGYLITSPVTLSAISTCLGLFLMCFNLSYWLSTFPFKESLSNCFRSCRYSSQYLFLYSFLYSFLYFFLIFFPIFSQIFFPSFFVRFRFIYYMYVQRGLFFVFKIISGNNIVCYQQLYDVRLFELSITFHKIVMQ